MEVVLLVETEISLLRILMDTEHKEAEWARARFDQLNLIEEKRMTCLWHGQCYQKWIPRVYNKKVKPIIFREGGLVLKKVIPFREDSRDKFRPNYEGH